MRYGVPLKRDGIEYLLWRHPLSDGEVTTVYAGRYPSRSTRVRVLYFPRTEHLDVWCQQNGVEEAVVGGFFLRDPYRPLGELWIDGHPARHDPSRRPTGSAASSVSSRRAVRLVSVMPRRRDRPAISCRPTDARRRRRCMSSNADEDHEGLLDGAGSSIRTSLRAPPACRARDLGEVASRSRVATGAAPTSTGPVDDRARRGDGRAWCKSAINLDGGGSTTLVHRGHLLNRPYSPGSAGARIAAGRSALAFEPRSTTPWTPCCLPLGVSRGRAEAWIL